MSSPQAVRRHKAGGIAIVVVLFALLVVMMAVAAPAMAASAKVASGNTELTVPKAQVAALTATNLAILPVSPVSFRFQWNAGVSWWFDLRMTPDSAFDYAAKKGTFYHSGKLRFVNVLTNQNLLMGGLQVIVTNPHAFALSSAVGTAPATRAIVFTAENSPKFTKQGKTIKIDGIQFKLTAAGALAIKTALGVDVSTTTLFADTDLQFKIK
jgi:hypothetical protein